MIPEQTGDPYAYVVDPYYDRNSFGFFYSSDHLNSFYTPAYVVIPTPLVEIL